MNFVCKNILISLMHNTTDVSHQVYFVQEFVCGRKCCAKLFRFSLMHCTDALMHCTISLMVLTNNIIYKNLVVVELCVQIYLDFH